MNASSQRGSAILMLFIAVALFGMIAYAFLQGSRGNISMLTNEASKASGYQSADCGNSVTMAYKRLIARGCTSISYNSDGSGSNSDGSCSIFHPNGGGAKTCPNYTMPPCTTTVIGAICPDGTYYAGITTDGSGKRMYVAPTDEGAWAWGPTVTQTHITSSNTGAANTAAIVALGASWPGHTACDAKTSNGHSDWYMPAVNELNLIYNGGARIAGVNPTGEYWGSEEATITNAKRIQMSDGLLLGSRNKSLVYLVRCVRKDP